MTYLVLKIKSNLVFVPASSWTAEMAVPGVTYVSSVEAENLPQAQFQFVSLIEKELAYRNMENPQVTLDKTPTVKEEKQLLEKTNPSISTYDDLMQLWKSRVIEALEESDYFQKEAALKVGITPHKMYRYCLQFGITHSHWKRLRPNPIL